MAESDRARLLHVRVPAGFRPERAYAVDMVLAEFLGLAYALEVQDRDDVEITHDDDPVGVRMPDVFFACPPDDWLTPRSLPADAPVARWSLPSALAWPGGPAELAAPFAAPCGEAGMYRVDGEATWFGIDVFGTAFFMLARYEETVAPVHDARGRFRADASLSGRSDLIRRPIVSEQVEALWRVLLRRWPRLPRRRRAFRVVLTHDVDVPFCVLGQSPRRVARQLAGDVLRRRDPGLALRRARSVGRTRRSGPPGDLCNTFDWIMRVSERHGLRSAFYFMAGHTGGAIDGDYRIDDPAVRRLIAEIASRGHELGVHPSYFTFRDGVALGREYAHMRNVAESAGTEQAHWGGRQHYLRWEAPTTWQIWADAGLTYDSTLGYAEMPGFRAGVCWEYPTFNVRSRERLALRERPLVAMETSLFDRDLLALTHDGAARVVDELVAQCRLYAGDFVLLWHNDNLIATPDRALYERIVEAVDPT